MCVQRKDEAEEPNRFSHRVGDELFCITRDRRRTVSRAAATQRSMASIRVFSLEDERLWRWRIIRAF
jgi:hypothetical protein